MQKRMTALENKDRSRTPAPRQSAKAASQRTSKDRVRARNRKAPKARASLRHPPTLRPQASRSSTPSKGSLQFRLTSTRVTANSQASVTTSTRTRLVQPHRAPACRCASVAGRSPRRTTTAVVLNTTPESLFSLRVARTTLRWMWPRPRFWFGPQR